MSQLECDYLVIGTGATGMAFVDTLLDECDASVIMVDNHHAPGGHWNDAYPFVRLHQPSHFYGVASTPLGSKRKDTVGSNAGYYELATGAEVQAYFERVMRERFLPSGRVQYFPMSEYLFANTGEHRFRNTLSSAEQTVQVKRRVVDSSYFNTTVPSRHERRFSVADGVRCIAPNDLPVESPKHSSYCVVGAGKTAMDAAVWLLDNNVDPNAITWICPRKSWLINREVTQGSVEFFVESIGGFANQMEAIAEASSLDDLFERLEACGFMLRIDPSEQPEMFHFATISKGEVAQLQRIEQVIQQGRVAAVTATGLHMTNGSEVSLAEGTLYIDCTASAVDFNFTPSEPIFQDERIVIQGVRVPNPCLSAAIIAYVEAHYDSDPERNRLCPPVALPDSQEGWLRSNIGNMNNQGIWGQEPELSAFITNCRLDGFATVIQNADPDNAEHAAILAKLGSNFEPAIKNLAKLRAQI